MITIREILERKLAGNNKVTAQEMLEGVQLLEGCSTIDWKKKTVCFGEERMGLWFEWK